MMEYSQPANQDTPSNVQDTIVVRMTRMGLGRGNHQGQQPRVLREQAGHTSASDQCEITSKMSCYAGAIHTGRSLHVQN